MSNLTLINFKTQVTSQIPPKMRIVKLTKGETEKLNVLKTIPKYVGS